MRIQTPPGMRDFYPDDMRLQNWLFDRWRDVSLRFGFQEYEGPIFEFLEMYETKSGAALTAETFRFEDRGGRQFAIRPEMTPTLARMVAARANALPRPIKWFSLPRMCRAERPQRGRLREFFQWNVDILGIEDSLADAEVIAVAVAFLKAVGLSADDVVMKISSRTLATEVLASIGVPPEAAAHAFILIDRMGKLSAEDFDKAWNEKFRGQPAPAAVRDILRGLPLEEALKRATESGSESGRGAAEAFEGLWGHLAAFGIGDYCEFDIGVVRGLAYYTGPVFEAYMRKVSLRALFGGGRYDDLTELFGGPKVTGVGFGAGDVGMLECLKEVGKLPELADQLDVFVIDAAEGLFPKVLEIAGKLREGGLTVDFSYKRQGVGKQFKQASARGARFAVLVGQEFVERGELAVKNLATGEQMTRLAGDVLRDAQQAFARA